MQAALEAVPITTFKNGPTEIVEKIAKQPLMLTQHGRSIAVVVSLEQWNDIVDQLEERQFTKTHMDALATAYHNRLRGDSDYVDGEDLKAMMAERNSHVADPV